MNNPNPFVPQGSLLEQQSKRRSRLKLGVFCVLAVGVAGLAAILIQGCKREQDQTSPDSDNSQPPADTNTVETDTNTPPTEASNMPPVAVTPPGQPPQAPPPPQPVPQQVAPPEAPPQPAASTEYVVVKGDTFSKIAKANGVTVKAIEDANPNVTPTRLKVGDKIVIPAGGTGTTGGTAATETENGVSTATGGDEVYVVKSGDTLTRIARHFGVTVKAIEAENNLTTTRIKVGKKLNIPAKAETAPAPVNAPPATTMAPDTAPAPAQGNPPPANPPAAQPSGTPGQ